MWLHLPSSVYSAVPDSSMPPSESLYQDLARSVTWRGKSLPPRSWRRVWKTAPSIRRLSGVTLQPSTAAAGVDSWMASLAEAHAKISPLPADEKVLEVSEADSLSTSSASPTKSSQDGCSGKTSEEWFQASLFTTDPTSCSTSTRYSSPRIARKRLASGGTLNVIENGYTGDFSGNTEYRHSSMSSADWKRWVTALRQDYSRRQKSALRTREIGCSYWPTPDANTSTYSNGKFGPNLRERAANWPTPRNTDGEKGGPNQAGSKGDLMLPSAAAQWATPNARDDHNPSTLESARTQRKLKQGWTIDLNEQAVFWKTPDVPNGGRTMKPEDIAANGMTDKGKRQVGLENQTRIWPTPSARDWKSGEASEETMDRNSRPLNEIACHYSHPDQETPKPGAASSPNTQTSRRRLNPEFTDWMMSLPGWTDSAPLETASWYSRLRWRLRCLRGEQD